MSSRPPGPTSTPCPPCFGPPVTGSPWPCSPRTAPARASAPPHEFGEEWPEGAGRDRTQRTSASVGAFTSRPTACARSSGTAESSHGALRPFPYEEVRQRWPQLVGCSASPSGAPSGCCHRETRLDPTGLVRPHGDLDMAIPRRRVEPCLPRLRLRLSPRREQRGGVHGTMPTTGDAGRPEALNVEQVRTPAFVARNRCSPGRLHAKLGGWSEWSR